MKTFLIDVSQCVGCYSCQIGCKDEHCGQCWEPYAKEQPLVGQFWMHVNQFERGNKPFVKVAYVPTLCQHCKNAPCINAATNGAIYRREDGLVIIDPEKAKGQKQIVDACPYHVIFWNEDLEIPQKCTGCAHLIDAGDEQPIHVPRCFDNCTHNAIMYGEESELDLEGAEKLHPEYDTQPSVWYKRLPKKFIAGTVYDPVAKEIIEGAVVSANSGSDTFTATTDDFGDFWLDGLPESEWTIDIAYGGKSKKIQACTKERDVGLGDIAFD